MEVNHLFTGSRKAWHSLYLQAAVETGIIGLLLLALLLGSLWWKGVRYWKATRDIVPLAATLCFMAVAVSVSGMDAISGVFLGIGFVAQDLRNFYVIREVVFHPRAATA